MGASTVRPSETVVSQPRSFLAGNRLAHQPALERRQRPVRSDAASKRTGSGFVGKRLWPWTRGGHARPPLDSSARAGRGAWPGRWRAARLPASTALTAVRKSAVWRHAETCCACSRSPGFERDRPDERGIVGMMATYNDAPELPSSLAAIPGGPPVPDQASQEKAIEALCRHLLTLPRETWRWG